MLRWIRAVFGVEQSPASGSAKPESKAPEKPPKRRWQATQPFHDLKLSHWVQIALTAALIFVGVSQLYVYVNQATVMHGQLSVMQTDSAIHRAELAGQAIGQ